MNESYNKKTVLITGSSRGIGASTARYFASKNYNVIINYNYSKDEAETLKKELEKYNTKIITVKCDVSNEEEVLNLKDIIKKEFNKIDVIVNNAGIAIDTTLEDKTVDNFKHILDINLIGTFLICKHIGLLMKEQKSGSIINVSSTNAIDTFYPYSMDYDASKSGVISLSHNFAKEYAPYVKVNTIAPGWVNTEMNKELDEEYIKEECNHILLNRFAEPEEIASEIYHIAESTYLNDSIIKVDGGRC